MKNLPRILGHRIQVKPFDEITISKGGIHKPEWGMDAQSSVYYKALVVSLGSAKDDNGVDQMPIHRPELQPGVAVLVMKSGFQALEDGTRVVSVKDVVAVLEAPEEELRRLIIG
jgi:hypothetical protein